MKPLIRYPGGKSRHTQKILMFLKGDESGYREPFVGGGSVYLASEFKNAWINDIDYGVYDLWRMVKEDPNSLIDQFCEHTITLDHRNKKSQIKHAMNLWKSVKDDIHHKIYPAGYRTLFLIKTCFSGNKMGGPTGGINQRGNYKITARWSEGYTINRIQETHKLIQDCRITNCTWENVLKEKGKDVSLFLDPPYLKKGKQCYEHSFDLEDHQHLANVVTSLNARYVVTLDDRPELRLAWEQCGVPDYRFIKKEWTYSMTSSRDKNPIGKELFIVSEDAYRLYKKRTEALVDVFGEDSV